MAVRDSETTPLLNTGQQKDVAKGKANSTVLRLLICVFIISLSVAFTWVPMIYVFRLMTCEEYYKTRGWNNDGGDRCSLPEIEAATAQAVSMLGITTTIFGVINLFFTGWTMQKWGVKIALIMQTVWPSLRLCCQILGVTVGAKTGIMIIQFSQVFCVMGGPAGYLLVTNTFASKVVDPSERTAIFGRLSGCVMFGTSFGYLLGGLSAKTFGIRCPFEVALGLMIISTAYSALLLPYVAPEKIDDAENNTKKGILTRVTTFVSPLKAFVPRRLRRANGNTSRYYGVSLLGAGVFLGVLATGFIPVLIQMYATNALGFGAADNGYLMALNSLVRGCFLNFAFPRVISFGRKHYGKRRSNKAIFEEYPSTPGGLTQTDFEPVAAVQAEQETVISLRLNKSSAPEKSSEFDLVFLTYSLVVDGLLTGCAACTRKAWQIYLAAVLLPLASGSAPAAKGVMMEIVPQSISQANALSAITLVEMIATLSTMSVFGELFALFAEMGKPHLIFICNAGVAVFSVAVLLCCRYPPQDVIADNETEQDSEQASTNEH